MPTGCSSQALSPHVNGLVDTSLNAYIDGKHRSNASCHRCIILRIERTLAFRLTPFEMRMSIL